MYLVDALREKGLSAREIDVAERVCRGLPNKDIAAELFVSEKTVKFHTTNIYKKMQVKSRSQLIVWSAPYLNFHEGPAVEKPQKTPATGGDFLAAGITKVGEV